jgi:alpha-tubulin suppressor-like RCC1 family protein
MIMCGKKHNVATCLNGNELYIWGNNSHRQLGIQKKDYIKKPKKLVLGTNKNKIIKICADNKSTFFLMSNLSTKDINIYVMSNSKKLLLNDDTKTGMGWLIGR